MTTKKHGTPSINAVGRSLKMLEAILSYREGRSVASLASAMVVPLATAHRQVATLIAEGILERMPGKPLAPGNRFLRLVQRFDEKPVIATVSAGALHRLAAELDRVAQVDSPIVEGLGSCSFTYAKG